METDLNSRLVARAELEIDGAACCRKCIGWRPVEYSLYQSEIDRRMINFMITYERCNYVSWSMKSFCIQREDEVLKPFNQ